MVKNENFRNVLYAASTGFIQVSKQQLQQLPLPQKAKLERQLNLLEREISIAKDADDLSQLINCSRRLIAFGEEIASMPAATKAELS